MLIFPLSPSLQVLASILAVASAEADADAFYGSYGSYGSVLPYTYTTRGFPAPLLRNFAAPAVPHVAAVPAVVAKTLQPEPSVITKVGSLSQCSFPQAQIRKEHYCLYFTCYLMCIAAKLLWMGGWWWYAAGS